MPELPNLVLVVFDAARRDRFGCYGYERLTTPTVDSLAREGLVVETMISNAPWTLPSHASLFTGLYPGEHGVQWQTGFVLRDSVPLTLAEALGGLGYDTWCVTNNALITEGTRLTRGFDHYATRGQIEGRMAHAVRHARRVVVGADTGGRATNRWLRERLAKAGRPLFLFVNYLETHWPWAPPRRLRRRVGPERMGLRAGLRYRAVVAKARPEAMWQIVPGAGPGELQALSTRYDGEVASADRCLGELLQVLEETGHLGRPTVVMVTSDHGDHLGEGGLADHHASLDDILIRVPFVVWGPGVVDAGRAGGTFEFVDLLPSTLDLVGKPVPDHLGSRRTKLFEGRSGPNDLAFAEWRAWNDDWFRSLSAKNPSFDFGPLRRDLLCARDVRYKLVRGGDGSEVVFDLLADPEETTDRSADRPEEAARLRRALDTQVAAWARWDSGTSGISPEEQAEIEAKLAELGYI